MLDKLISYIKDGHEWIFSGIGILAITTIGGLFKFLFTKKKDDTTFKQINKDNSSGTQIGIQNNYYNEVKKNE